MTRHKTDVITDRKQLLADRVNQLLVIPHGEVSTANRSGKNHVTHPGQLRLSMQKYDVPRCVSGAVNHLKGLFTHGDDVAILQPAIGRKRLGAREARHFTPLRQLVDPEAVTLLGAFHGHRQLLAQHVRRGAVIKMPMSQQDLLDRCTHFGDRSLNALHVTTGINDGCQPGRFALDNRAVLLIGGDGHHLHFQAHAAAPVVCGSSRSPS